MTNSNSAVTPSIDARASNGDSLQQPLSNPPPLPSPVRQLSGNTPLDSGRPSIHPSPIQTSFGSAPGSGGGTPSANNPQGLHGLQNQSFMPMGAGTIMDGNRWNPQWSGLPLSTMPQPNQPNTNETDGLARQMQQASQQLHSGMSSIVGTPIHQPSLNSLMPPRGRPGQPAAIGNGSLDPSMFVGMTSNDRQRGDGRGSQHVANQPSSAGARVNLGWASGAAPGSRSNNPSTNVSPVIPSTTQSSGPTHATGSHPQNLSGGNSSVSSRQASPIPNTNPSNTNAAWPDVQNATAQLQQQRSSISHGGLLGMMANHPASGHPTPLGSPLTSQQPLQYASQAMPQHQLNPDINMMQAIGLNMMRNGHDTEFARRLSATGTLDHSSGSNTPHTTVGPSGSNTAFSNMPGQFNMSVPGMGMAPRPFNMAQSQLQDSHFPQQFSFAGAPQGGMAGSGTTSPINPLGIAFGQQLPGSMGFQPNMGQASFANQYGQGLHSNPQGILTGHNLGMPTIRSSLSLPGSPALTSAKSLDSSFNPGSQGVHHQHQPHVHSSLANKVDFAISPDDPIQPKLEPVDIAMTNVMPHRTGSKSAPTSRQGTPPLVAIGAGGILGTKRSASGTRRKDKEKAEPVYSYSGAQSTIGPINLHSDGGVEEHDHDVREEKIDHRKRKRNRTIQSCLPCHQNKRKCDRKKPCSRCKTLGLVSLESFPAFFCITLRPKLADRVLRIRGGSQQRRVRLLYQVLDGRMLTSVLLETIRIRPKMTTCEAALPSSSKSCANYVKRARAKRLR